MKIKCLLFLLILTVTQAQGQVLFGLKAGYNLANLTYTGVIQLQDQKPQSNLNAGAFVLIPLSSFFSLQPEILYSGQGTNYKVGNENAAYHYNYLNIPILIKFQHPTHFFAETGLQIAFPLSATQVVDGHSTSILNKTYSPDYAWVAGLGYLFSEANIGIDFRYNLGLINIAHQDAGDLTVKHSVFQFSLFYLF